MADGPKKPEMLVAIGIVRWEDQFLVGARREDQTWPGRDEFPGGKVEYGETIDQAVWREVREETGIDIRLMSWRREVIIPAGHKNLRLVFVLCEPIEDIEPEAPFRWIKRQDLLKLEFPPANMPILQELIDRKDEEVQ
ncbi:MAG: NUDIX domain-containing protein [Gemmatales bacterium]